MQVYDWSRFVLRVPIKASREKIYKAWTSQQGLESWFLRKAEFTKADGQTRKDTDSVQIADKYEWLWHGWPDDVVERGVILQENGSDLLKFTFGKAGNVTVTVKQEEGEHILELLQDEIPTDEKSQVTYHMGCTKGWLFYMTNLKSILEGGIDLRNRNMQLTDVLNS
jgi:uncharacterized protein YndB with AHSA1/START domain